MHLAENGPQNLAKVFESIRPMDMDMSDFERAVKSCVLFLVMKSRLKIHHTSEAIEYLMSYYKNADTTPCPSCAVNVNAGGYQAS